MTGSHLRNTLSMRTSLRCGARTRSGETCRAPAAHGKTRCRMHGGAKGSGARRKNRNALKHGWFTKKAVRERRNLKNLLEETREFLQELSQGGDASLRT